MIYQADCASPPSIKLLSSRGLEPALNHPPIFRNPIFYHFEILRL